MSLHNRRLLTTSDVQGAWAIIPTPAKPNASDWREESTVDIDEAVDAVERLIASGVDAIMSLGTFGEGSTLTWEEKRQFMGAVAETIRGRVPFFGGTTSLNTRDTIYQTRMARDLGVDGTMLGPPMWCRPDLQVAVQFFKDVAEAVPDMAICVYANPEAFKFDFPRPFWAAMAEIPQVICAKYLNIAQLMVDLRLSKGRIRFLVTEGDHYPAARIDPENCTAFWTSGAVCGPAPSIKLRDEVRAAVESGDWSRAKSIADELKTVNGMLVAKGDMVEFGRYNIGLEKERINTAGWMKAGPCRPPYTHVPEEYLKLARLSGEAWVALDRKYAQ